MAATDLAALVGEGRARESGRRPLEAETVGLAVRVLATGAGEADGTGGGASSVAPCAERCCRTRKQSRRTGLPPWSRNEEDGGNAVVVADQGVARASRLVSHETGGAQGSAAAGHRPSPVAR